MAFSPATAHVERHPIPGLRLGRRPADVRRINDPARTLRLRDILRVDHAPTADHLSSITSSPAPWNMLGNDKYGDCGPVSVANSRKVTLKGLLTQDYSPNLNDVFDLYKRSGNPSFNPSTGAGDNGVNMNDMLAAVQAGGFAGSKSVAFASVDVTNQDECDAAIDIFGFLLLGIDLKVAQQTQTNARPPVWDYKKSGEWGGHAVIAGKYTGGSGTAADRYVETWAQIVGTTDAFWQRQVQEAWIVIWPEHLGSAAFHAGINGDLANTAFSDLTGKPGPFPTTPPAPPVDPPVDPGPPITGVVSDADLWAASKAWAAGKGLL